MSQIRRLACVSLSVPTAAAAVVVLLGVQVAVVVALVGLRVPSRVAVDAIRSLTTSKFQKYDSFQMAIQRHVV